VIAGRHTIKLLFELINLKLTTSTLEKEVSEFATARWWY